MTKTILARICAVSLALSCVGMAMWWFDHYDWDQGVRFAQRSNNFLVLLFTALLPVACFPTDKFTTGFQKWAARESAWQFRLLFAWQITMTVVVFHWLAAIPLWVVLGLFTPFVAAFIFPGFAYDDASSVSEVPSDAPETGSGGGSLDKAHIAQRYRTEQWIGSVFLIAFVIVSFVSVSFYIRISRPALWTDVVWMIGLCSISVAASRDWYKWILAPVIDAARRFKCTALLKYTLLVGWMLFFPTAKDTLPYWITKYGGYDVVDTVEVKSRKWFPDRPFCKGELEIRGREVYDYELCFEKSSDFAGLEVGAKATATERRSSSGRYVSEIRVMK